MSCLSHAYTDVFEDLCDELGIAFWTLDIAFIKHFRNKLYDNVSFTFMFYFYVCCRTITSAWGLSSGYEVFIWIIFTLEEPLSLATA